MKCELIHLDSKNKISTTSGDISFLAFIKYATFAGINTPYHILHPFRYASFFPILSHFFLDQIVFVSILDLKRTRQKLRIYQIE